MLMNMNRDDSMWMPHECHGLCISNELLLHILTQRIDDVGCPLSVSLHKRYGRARVFQTLDELQKSPRQMKSLRIFHDYISFCSHFTFSDILLSFIIFYCSQVPNIGRTGSFPATHWEMKLKCPSCCCWFLPCESAIPTQNAQKL